MLSRGKVEGGGALSGMIFGRLRRHCEAHRADAIHHLFLPMA